MKRKSSVQESVLTPRLLVNLFRDSEMRLMGYIDKKLDEQEVRLDERLDKQEVRLDEKFTEQEKRLDERLAEQSDKIDKRLGEQSESIDQKLIEISGNFDKKLEEQGIKFDTKLEDIKIYIQEENKKQTDDIYSVIREGNTRNDQIFVSRDEFNDHTSNPRAH